MPRRLYAGGVTSRHRRRIVTSRLRFVTDCASIRLRFDTEAFRYGAHHDIAAPYPRRWWTLVVLRISLLVISLDNTILNVALPSLSDDLGASASQLQWIVDAYMLVFAGLLLTAGSLGDRFGRKRALTLGLVDLRRGLCGVGAVRSRPAALIASRALMGIGGALIMPSTLSILTAIFPAEERPKAIGIWAAVAGLGIAIGPVAGGWLVEHADWHWVFLVNVPFVLVALARRPARSSPSRATRASRGSTPSARRSRPPGWAPCCGAIIEAPDRGWTDGLIVGAFAARRRDPGGVRPVGAAHDVADARHAPVPQPALLGRERRHHDRVLRA